MLRSPISSSTWPGQASCCLAAVEQGHLVAAGQGVAHLVRADEAGAAEDQDAQPARRPRGGHGARLRQGPAAQGGEGDGAAGRAHARLHGNGAGEVIRKPDGTLAAVRVCLAVFRPRRLDAPDRGPPERRPRKAGPGRAFAAGISPHRSSTSSSSSMPFTRSMKRSIMVAKSAKMKNTSASCGGDISAPNGRQSQAGRSGRARRRTGTERRSPRRWRRRCSRGWRC